MSFSGMLGLIRQSMTEGGTLWTPSVWPDVNHGAHDGSHLRRSRRAFCCYEPLTDFIECSSEHLAMNWPEAIESAGMFRSWCNVQVIKTKSNWKDGFRKFGNVVVRKFLFFWSTLLTNSAWIRLTCFALRLVGFHGERPQSSPGRDYCFCIMTASERLPYCHFMPSSSFTVPLLAFISNHFLKSKWRATVRYHKR